MSSKQNDIIEQYRSIEKQHPDCILLCRIGEFYEIIGDTAQKTHKILNITLTQKGQTPMCGFPKTALTRYCSILIKNNLKIAVCEQDEECAGDNNAIMTRRVTRIITPGTIATYENEFLTEDNIANYLMAIKPINDECFAISWADLGTGEIAYAQTKKLQEAISGLSPAEIIADDKTLALLNTIMQPGQACLSHFVYNQKPDPMLYEQYNKYFYEMTRPEKAACATILAYIKHTNAKTSLKLPKKNADNDKMFISNAAMQTLEIFKTQSGKTTSTLFAHLNNTTTPMGARMLRKWLMAPYARIKPIRQRLEVVRAFYHNAEAAVAIRNLLKQCPDLEKCVTKVRANSATPKDLALIKDAVEYGIDISGILLSNFALLDANDSANYLLKKIFSNLCDPRGVMLLIKEALFNILNSSRFSEGTCINTLGMPQLQILRLRLEQETAKLKKLEYQYQKTSGSKKLTVKANPKHGYCIVLPSREAEILLGRTDFFHICVNDNKMLFHTNELYIVERHIHTAKNALINAEQEILKNIFAQITQHSETIYLFAAALAKLDVLVSFAVRASEFGYTEPALNDGNGIILRASRHPILEQKVANFIHNDLNLNNSSWLITAPNMSGKSTFLRQAALIVVMAQLGSYVPAAKAEIGIVDKLFIRMGAHDAILQGMSTFMLEMREAADILTNVTNKSLVILDEIGRGTCFREGSAIALAIIEHLCVAIKCRTLFATHFYHLPKQAKHIQNLHCYTMQTQYVDGKITFCHKISTGCGVQSMALEIALLAGMPDIVIDRARKLASQTAKNY